MNSFSGALLCLILPLLLPVSALAKRPSLYEPTPQPVVLDSLEKVQAEFPEMFSLANEGRAQFLNDPEFADHHVFLVWEEGVTTMPKSIYKDWLPLYLAAQDPQKIRWLTEFFDRQLLLNTNKAVTPLGQMSLQWSLNLMEYLKIRQEDPNAYFSGRLFMELAGFDPAQPNAELLGMDLISSVAFGQAFSKMPAGDRLTQGSKLRSAYRHLYPDGQADPMLIKRFSGIYDILEIERVNDAERDGFDAMKEYLVDIYHEWFTNASKVELVNLMLREQLIHFTHFRGGDSKPPFRVKLFGVWGWIFSSFPDLLPHADTIQNIEFTTIGTMPRVSLLNDEGTGVHFGVSDHNSDFFLDIKRVERSRSGQLQITINTDLTNDPFSKENFEYLQKLLNLYESMEGVPIKININYDDEFELIHLVEDGHSETQMVLFISWLQAKVNDGSIGEFLQRALVPTTAAPAQRPETPVSPPTELPDNCVRLFP